MKQNTLTNLMAIALLATGLTASAADFTTPIAAPDLVFDEAEGDTAHGGGRVAAVIVSPAYSRPGYQSTTLYQHASLLRLTLEGLGIRTLPGAAASAPAMWEFFTFPPPP